MKQCYISAILIYGYTKNTLSPDVCVYMSVGIKQAGIIVQFLWEAIGRQSKNNSLWDIRLLRKVGHN